MIYNDIKNELARIAAEICDIQPLNPYGDNLWNNINQNND